MRSKAFRTHLAGLLALASLLLLACSNPTGGPGGGGGMQQNQPPAIDGTLTTGGMVDGQIDLDASATDPDGDALAFSWTFLSLPAASSLTDADIENATSLYASFTPDVAGTYELQLSVSDGEATTTELFTVTVTSGPPQEPVLVAPADGAGGVARSAQLQWSSAGASAYTVYLDDAAFTPSTLPPPVATGQTASSYDPPGNLAYNTTYYWLIVATNADGDTTGDVWSFTTIVEKPAASVLVAPAANAVLNTSSVTIDWNSAARATTYRLFHTPPSGAATQKYSGGSTQYTLTGLADGSHSFWVVAENAGGSTQSVTRSFAVDTVPPVLNITGGPIGPTNDSTPTFLYSASGATTIECRVGTGAYQSCGSSSHTTSALSDGSYTFSVRASDAAGNTTTRTRSFSVDTVAPSAPIIFSSPDDLIVNASQVEYSFGYLTFPGAPAPNVTYECRFYTTSPSTPFPLWQSCSSPRVFSVTTSRSYRFDVRAVDPAGNRSPVRSHEFQNQYLG
ncbi:MAG: Ig-like domain-containing protein [Spirochaetales bacterium]